MRAAKTSSQLSCTSCSRVKMTHTETSTDSSGSFAIAVKQNWFKRYDQHPQAHEPRRSVARKHSPTVFQLCYIGDWLADINGSALAHLSHRVKLHHRLNPNVRVSLTWS